MSLNGQLKDTPEGCKGCCFRHTASNASICAYALYMGELRNCPGEECQFYSNRPRGAMLRQEKLEKRVEEEMHDRNLEAPWVGCEPDEYEDVEEYIPEYYPECECDYDY